MAFRGPLSFFLIWLVVGGGLAFSQTGEESEAAEAPPPDAARSYQTGRDLEARNRQAEADVHYNEAIRICTGEIAQNQGTRNSYTVLTWALYRQKKYREVISWGEQGLRLFENHYPIVETMGEAYFYLNNYDASLRFMQRYVNGSPRGERASVAYFFIGEIFRLQQKFRRADIAYTTAVALEPNLALWWFRLGEVREAAGDTAPAKDAYERAIRLNPTYREALAGLDRVR